MAPSLGVSKQMNRGEGQLTGAEDDERRFSHRSSSGCHVTVRDVAPQRSHVVSCVEVVPCL